ncbi:MAG: 23S rRNA (pseudouridine(1915)-N(3))-methyltransferase RlmH [Pseudomonadota bacterium]
MNLTIVAVGRARSGPEVQLVSDYMSRTARTGRSLGIADAAVKEVEDKRGAGPSGEADLLRRALPKDCALVCLDERGKQVSSPDLATMLASWRDAGQRDVAFVIGGADGLDPDLRAEADIVLSFGQMVWPHMLARVMLAEQLYRAVSILAGTPYHRA